ncbi:hypothetical protein BH10ACT7_BH10ACT7_01810 [soil metagenome]
MRSPWERALGVDAARLHPSLATYFRAIPAGHVGRGSGVFETVGTPRHLLWPVLALLSVEGIVFPVWARHVPFTVINRPTLRGTVRAHRIFHFPDGDRTMIDEVGITESGLVDRLGRRGTLESALTATVVDGRLELRSTSVTIRAGRARIPLGPFSPRVKLVERNDGDRQHVSLVLDAPLIGRLYEYSGSFDYRIEKDD